MPAYKCKQTGKWMARFYYTAHDGTRKQKKKRGFDLKREAEEYEREFLSSIQGQPTILFSTLCEEYLKDSKQRNKRTTYELKESTIRVHIAPFFGKKPVNEITPSDIRNWQNNQLKLKAAPSSLSVRSGLLSGIFNHAIKFFGLLQNPVTIVGGVRSSKTKEVRFWTLDEFNTFISHVDDPYFNNVFTVLFYTGVRIGELLALTLEDFDFDNKILSISKTLTRKGEITPPKTEKSRRTIVLPNNVINSTKKYIDKLHDPKPDEFIFAKFSYYTIRSRLTKYAKIAGVQVIHIHDLRHSHASLLIHNDINPLIIQERLGHEDVQTTLSTYSHLYPNRQQEVADLINNISPF